MPYQSTKTYGHNLGFSAAFRQWRAGSHCSLLHGYALGFRFVFEADELDDRNWVVDFGDLKWLKDCLSACFDHTTLVAHDDPHYEDFAELEALGLIKLVQVDATGCEAFAKLAYGMGEQFLGTYQGFERAKQRVRLVSVEVSEHGANSAIYTGTPS